jgi:hypothetical protein
VTTIPAIAALREYIEVHYGGSVTAFARENKLDVAELGKIVRGQRGQRMTVRYADKIERATNGIVSLKMWVPVRS